MTPSNRDQENGIAPDSPGIAPELCSDEELTVEELEINSGGATGSRTQCGAPGHYCPLGYTNCYAGMCYP